MEGPESIEIVGLGDTPVTVDSQGTVTPSTQGAVEQDVPAEMQSAVGQDVMADMRAAVADMMPSAQPAGEPSAEDAGPPEDEVDDEPAAEPTADEKPADDGTNESADKADDEEETEDKLESAEEKPEDEADDKAEEEEPAKEEAPVVEPSESDKLVEELGGVEVLKAAQPFVESVYDPNLRVSERVSRLEAFVPEGQMKDIRTEIFWQGAETREIQDMLVADQEAREIYAQKIFGVPFGYLEQVFNEHKGYFTDQDFAEALSEYKTEHPLGPKAADDKPAAPEKPADEKKDEPKQEEKQDEPQKLTPAFQSILNNLSTDVDAIFVAADLEPSDKDDDDTRRLKTEASTQFETDWPKAFMADEEAMKAYRQVKGLSDQGADAQAQQKYATLARHAKRVATELIARVTKPLDDQRSAKQERARAAAAARAEKPKAVKQTEIESPSKGAGADISTLRSDADIARAMEESIDRNTKKP